MLPPNRVLTDGFISLWPSKPVLKYSLMETSLLVVKVSAKCPNVNLYLQLTACYTIYTLYKFNLHLQFLTSFFVVCVCV